MWEEFSFSYWHAVNIVLKREQLFNISLKFDATLFLSFHYEFLK